MIPPTPPAERLREQIEKLCAPVEDYNVPCESGSEHIYRDGYDHAIADVLALVDAERQQTHESRSPDGDGPAASSSAFETDGPHGPLPMARRRSDAGSATGARTTAGSEPADSHHLEPPIEHLDNWRAQTSRLHLESEEKLTRLRAAQQELEQESADWEQSFATGKPMKNGQHAHLLICSGSRSEPAGTIGISCCCNPRVKAAVSRAQLAQRGLTDLIARLRALCETWEKRAEHFKGEKMAPDNAHIAEGLACGIYWCEEHAEELRALIPSGSAEETT